MKIKFDSTLDFQLEAINSIVNIFQGQEKCESNFSIYSPGYFDSHLSFEENEIGYGNRLAVSDNRLLNNIQNIQLANGLRPASKEEIDRNNLDFTIEMETGTGKTYVYLRTIMELYRKYGFSKHIIVVPSIPIKEGVFKSLQITEEHFRELYDNINYHYFIYNSSNLSEVRQFSTNSGLEIMVINIDAFRKSFENPVDAKKKANIIHRYNDSLGYKPLDLIKNTNPVVIIDEPQSTMSTDLAKKAIKGLNPMVMLRYSATHKEKVNLMYKLDAVDAYEKKLVKQIEVGSVIAQGINNNAYINLLQVRNKNGRIEARVEVNILDRGHIKRKKIWVKQNDDLEEITGREEYEGYIIQDIYLEEGREYIDFTGREEELRLGQIIGGIDDKQLKRALISKTIEEHLDKELHLNKLGIKILTLFFIDTVKKYRIYDEEGNSQNGEYAQIFEEEYKKIIRKTKYASLFEGIHDIDTEVGEIHNGYFSIDKKRKAGNKKERYEIYKDTRGNTKADEDTYHLIMRDKEKLLSFDSKLRFIFSHSALKEGWDNPNVFQICTLKEAGKSEIRRRQEIGRGLRLAVNQNGERVYGHEINTLTVMASESYMDFVDNLQKEIEKVTGIRFGILEEHSFSNIVISIDEETVQYLGQEKSFELYNYLLATGYINKTGKVQDLLRMDLKEEKVLLPYQFTKEKHIEKQILNKLKEAAGKLEIKNRDDKKRIKINREILNSPEFKELWDRVKYKTTFAVDFNSDSLINACISSLDANLHIKRGKLFYTKARVKMSTGSVEAEEERAVVSNLKEKITHLPDIVSYLQNETQLTRKSIVKILTGTIKLRYFKINPQMFIESCISIINEQMRHHIVDGIKYKKMGDSEFYSQELFKNEELFGYIKSNLIKSEKSPYEYVVYDSNIESKLSTEFEKSDNIPVYAKLPGWFQIDTPLGKYNPDWAILWKDENEEKLFFVVESKGKTGMFDLRPKEKGKIICGEKHFKEIGSEMIVVSEFAEVENHALSK